MLIKLSAILLVNAALLSHGAIADPDDNLKVTRQQLLQQFDSDGDGRLSAAEKKQAQAQYRAKQLAKYDTDGSGDLSTDERDLMKKDRQAAKAKYREKIMATYDLDGDGKLSPEEKKSAKAAGAFNPKQRYQRGKKPQNESAAP